MGQRGRGGARFHREEKKNPLKHLFVSLDHYFSLLLIMFTKWVTERNTGWLCSKYNSRRNNDIVFIKISINGCFQKGRPLCIEILPGHSRPLLTILRVRKLETPTDTRWWRPHLSAFPHFDTIPECGGRTDRCAIEYTVLAKLALWHAVKAEIWSHWKPRFCYWQFWQKSYPRFWLVFGGCHFSSNSNAVKICVEI